MNTRLYAVVTFGVAMALLACEAQAEPPRLFAELAPADDPCVKWESESSRRIVSSGGGPVDVIEFITPAGPWLDDDAIVRDEDEVVLDLRSTVWRRMPVVHVTTSGAELISHVYWLEEDLDNDGIPDPAVPGMTASTGPGGDVIEFVEIRISRVDSGDSYNPNRFYITADGDNRFCIAVGCFQR